MSQPLFRRFWVAVLKDGTCLSQFDPDGNYHAWDPAMGHEVTKLMFLPISKEFAEKIRSKGDLAEPSNLPIIELPVKDYVEYSRKCFIKRIPHPVCGFCGAELPTNTWEYCRRCFAESFWYCSECDSLKVHPATIQMPNGTGTICPDCRKIGKTQGLLRIECIHTSYEERFSHCGLADIDGVRHYIFDMRPA